ncbi:MAG: ABC transporter ATP-binding protein [Deltaproteobacteria bacterium]|jgi:iron complex transport system ATP-binding protein|nr:ABC transporter ATP-binding protein [Deltaproteobacteria bacterium]
MELIFHNVACGYGGRTVVEGFGCVVGPGDVTCLLGPNGAGKTTLLKAALGLVPLTAGRIAAGGRDLADLGRAGRARLLGHVPQGLSTPFAYKVSDVVLTGRTSRLGLTGRPGAADYEAARKAADELGLGPLMGRPFTELSGGERQLVSVARALAREPAFLVMDEPTSSLDFANQARVMQAVRRLAARGLGVLLTTHSPDQALASGTRAVLMRPGRPSLEGPVAEVLTPENLSRTYGLEVGVFSCRGPDGLERKFCRPVSGGGGRGG